MLDNVILTSDLIDSTVELVVVKNREKNGIVEVSQSRKLTQQEVYSYLELLMKYHLGDNDETYLVNKKDGIRYDIKRSKSNKRYTDKIYEVKFNEIFLERLKTFVREVSNEHKVVKNSSLDYLLEFVMEIVDRAKLKEK